MRVISGNKKKSNYNSMNLAYKKIVRMKIGTHLTFATQKESARFVIDKKNI